MNSPTFMPSTTEVQDENSIVSLTRLDADAQTDYLLEQEEIARKKEVANQRVYLLREEANDTFDRILKVRNLMLDVDGSLTGIGDRTLYPSNIEALKRLHPLGVKAIATTGRHYGQVAELWENHKEGTGIDHWMIEQGFYETATGGNPEFLLGNRELESYVETIQERISLLIPDLEREFGVSFVQTSSEGYPVAHQSMYSIDAHSQMTGKKIDVTEKALHEVLLERFKNYWQRKDQANLIAKTGTSSIGTYEWTVDHINKSSSMKRFTARERMKDHTIGIVGDSSNDEPLFESPASYLKTVVVNAHTSKNLIENAHIATVGTGNASPFFNLMHRLKVGK